MTDKEIINDYKAMIHNLQRECTEKTNNIVALSEQLKRKEQELSNEKQAAQIDIGNLNRACLELRQELEEREQECEELRKANIHIYTNRKFKDQKLKRIEDLIINCQSGYTDEFIQELLSIILENEPSITDLIII